MLQVDIIIAPGGWMDDAHVIQRIAAWNVSDLAEISDYEYVVSRPLKPGVIGMTPSGLWLAHNRDNAEFVERTGFITGHKRSDGAIALVAKILADQ